MLAGEARWIEAYKSPGLDEIIARFGTVSVTYVASTGRNYCTFRYGWCDVSRQDWTES